MKDNDLIQFIEHTLDFIFWRVCLMGLFLALWIVPAMYFNTDRFIVGMVSAWVCDAYSSIYKHYTKK